MELYNLLKDNLDIFAWKPADMTGVPRSIAERRLNIREGCQSIRQKRRGQADAIDFGCRFYSPMAPAEPGYTRRRKNLQKRGGCFGLAQQAGSAAAINQQHRLRCIMPKSTDVDHHDTAYYIPMYHRTGGFTGEEREVYKSLVNRLFHEGRVVLPNFLDDEPNLRNIFAAIGFDCLLDINEQICPVFVLQFYKSVRFIRNLNGTLSIAFVIDNVKTTLTLENFA
ncbi:hypothetical protein Tco_0108795 [Tanacetum coccineum]